MKLSSEFRWVRLGSALLSELSKEPIVLSFGKPERRTVVSVTLSGSPADNTCGIEVIASTPSLPWGPLSYQALNLTVGKPRIFDDPYPF